MDTSRGKGRRLAVPARLPTAGHDKTARFTASPRNAEQWYKIVNYGTDNFPATIYLYDEIGYWGKSAQDFVDELQGISAREIHVHINSPGGEVFDGQAIYSCLRNHPARITTIVDGLAASAASFIAQAGDHRVISRGATMMIHDAAGLCWGNATDMHQMADVLGKLSDNIADIYSNRGGGTVEEWREAMRAETWYTAAEAVAAGLCDEMTDPDEADDDKPDEMSNRWDLTVFNYAGRDAAPGPGARTVPAPVAQDTPVEEPEAVELAAEDAETEPAAAGTEPVADVEESAPEPAEPADPGQAEPAAEDALDATPAVETEPAATEAVPQPSGLDSDDGPAADDQAPAPPEVVAAETVTPPEAAADTWLDLPDWARDDTTDEATTWSHLVAHLTPPTPSTVDDEFARLREALQ